MVAMNQIYLAMGNEGEWMGVAGIMIILGMTILSILALLLPLFIYLIYNAARRIEKRLDVMLQHMAIYTQHVNAEEMRGRVRKP